MIRYAWVFILFGSSICGCQMHNYTERGAAMGGLTGGGLGALIGEAAADEPLAGAAIGSALGALTGATVGSGLDEIDARNDARIRQAVYAQSAEGTSLQEVLAMTDSGLSEQVITRHVRSHGYSGSLDAADLIALRRQGVSDQVIGALQDAVTEPVRLAQAETVVVEPAPVFVQERYHSVPVPIMGPRPWRYGRRGPCPPYEARPNLHWGVSFGH